MNFETGASAPDDARLDDPLAEARRLADLLVQVLERILAEAEKLESEGTAQ